MTKTKLRGDFMDIIDQIRSIGPDKINDALLEFCNRFEELNPAAELHLFTLSKKEDRNEQINLLIEFIKKHKTSQ